MKYAEGCLINTVQFVYFRPYFNKQNVIVSLILTASAKVKRGKYSKKDVDCYKLNNKGRKYLVFRSGDGKIVKIWGGYSPKLYDGHFIELFKDEIEKLTGGMDIIGD